MCIRDRVKAFRSELTNLALVGLSRVLHRDSAEIITVDVLLWNIYVAEECFTGLTFVGIGVRDWHIALVTKEDMNARPIHRERREIGSLRLGSVVQARQLAKETNPCAATGEHYAGDAIFMQAAARGLDCRNPVSYTHLTLPTKA